MENTKTALAEREDVTNESWGTREEIATTGNRLRAMLPGVKNEAEAQRLAQATILARANPFRGELYIFGDNIVEGYKLLVRWAKRQEDYTANYTQLAADDPQMAQVKNAKIGHVCEVWRDSVKADLVNAVKSGIPYDVAATMFQPERAVGIVTSTDMGREPPKGWTWDQVSKKRALKNALNLAYGMPSPDELVKESWEVDGQETEPEDWRGADGLNSDDSAALAKSNAQWREHEAAMQNDQTYREEHKAQNKAAASALFGGPVVDGELIDQRAQEWSDERDAEVIAEFQARADAEPVSEKPAAQPYEIKDQMPEPEPNFINCAEFGVFTTKSGKMHIGFMEEGQKWPDVRWWKGRDEFLQAAPWTGAIASKDDLGVDGRRFSCNMRVFFEENEQGYKNATRFELI